MRILIVDPGKVTGFGFLDVTSFESHQLSQLHPEVMRSSTFEGWELPHFEFLEWAEGVVRAETLGSLAGLVCESFSIRRDSQQTIGGDRLYSTEQIGNLRYWCRSRWFNLPEIPYVEQTPTDMKTFDAKKTKTKKLGWWAEPRGTGYAGHRRDAASHALLYAVRNRLINPKELV